MSGILRRVRKGAASRQLPDASPDRARSRRIDQPQRGLTGDQHVKEAMTGRRICCSVSTHSEPLCAADCRLMSSLVMGADLLILSFLLHHPVHSAARANSAICNP